MLCFYKTLCVDNLWSIKLLNIMPYKSATPMKFNSSTMPGSKYFYFYIPRSGEFVIFYIFHPAAAGAGVTNAHPPPHSSPALIVLPANLFDWQTQFLPVNAAPLLQNYHWHYRVVTVQNGSLWLAKKK